MENPLHTFSNLSKKGKVAVVAGAVGVGGLLWWRAKKSKENPASQTDESASQTEDSVSYQDEGGDGGLYDPTNSTGAGSYYGGFGSTTPAALTEGGLTAEDPGGTLNSPQAAPVNIYLGGSPTDPAIAAGEGMVATELSPSTGITGGGAPNTVNAAKTHLVNLDPGSPRKGQSYTTIKNKDGSTTHVYADGTKVKMPASKGSQVATPFVQGKAVAVSLGAGGSKPGAQATSPKAGESYVTRRIKDGKNSGTYHVYPNGRKVLVGKY